MHEENLKATVQLKFEAKNTNGRNERFRMGIWYAICIRIYRAESYSFWDAKPPRRRWISVINVTYAFMLTYIFVCVYINILI